MWIGKLTVKPLVVGTCWALASCLIHGCSEDDDCECTRPGDVTPPAAVSDLTVLSTTDSSATLAWFAPGDDCLEGTAAQYDLRYSTAPITAVGWEAALPVADVGSPKTAGSEEAHTVDGLDAETVYYFALKTADEVPNWSCLSNVASDTTFGTTVGPILVVSPTKLNFVAAATQLVFTIGNGGAGTLEWSITDDQDWVSVSTLSGSTTTELDEVVVTVSRQGLAPGEYSGTITMASSVSGAQQVEVEMVVLEEPPPSGMVFVPAGSFVMGDGAANCGVDEHVVTLTRHFLLGQHEVTNQEYLDAVQWAYDQGHISVSASSVRDNLDEGGKELLDLDDEDCEIAFEGGAFILRDIGHGINPDHPVKEVSWYGAARFCDWLSLQEGLPRAYEHDPQVQWSCNAGDPYGALGYRLPTDAEWEYAARFGDERIYPWGDELPDCSRANYQGCVTWTVGVSSYPAAPEALGLSEMAGNVCEWCNDRFRCDLGTDPRIDPTGETGEDLIQVVRAGSWYDGTRYLRCAKRAPCGIDRSGHQVGFRVARTAGP